MNKPIKIWIIRAAVVVQVFSLVLFVGEVYIDTFGKGLIYISWQVHEAIEITAMLGLLIGFALGVTLIRNLLSRNSKVESQLRVASGEFHSLLKEHFVQWGLSPSETDVAYFAIKGMSNNEIAELRGTSDGTVKAQLNAVYRKAGLESRTQLLGYFIEELMAKEAEG
jgi:DNA-binding NarL/FixJ family response regulator